MIDLDDLVGYLDFELLRWTGWSGSYFHFLVIPFGFF